MSLSEVGAPTAPSSAEWTGPTDEHAHRALLLDWTLVHDPLIAGQRDFGNRGGPVLLAPGRSVPLGRLHGYAQDLPCPVRDASHMVCSRLIASSASAATRGQFPSAVSFSFSA